MAKVLIAYSPRKIGYNAARIPQLDRNIYGTVLGVEKGLSQMGYTVKKVVLRKNPSKFLAEFYSFKPNVIFNLCEEVGGDTSKEKSAAALFEMLGVPCTGSRTLALAVCFDKAMTKRILMGVDLPTPPFIVASDHDKLDIPFHLPAIVKPVHEDGSLGISSRSVVATYKSLRNRIRYVLKTFRQPAMVEKFIAGREFQVSLIGSEKPEILAVAELSFKGLPSSLPRICTYSAKWQPASRYYKYTTPVIPAKVDGEVERNLREISLKIFDFLCLRGYARIDFRVSRNRPFVIDVNPNPDLSSDAGFARAAAYAGMTYPMLLDRLVKLAMESP